MANPDRLHNLQKLCTHPWYSRLINKLKASDFELIKAFCDKNLDVEKGEFELKVNRLFVDDKTRPKNYGIILELLLVINTEQ